MNKWEVFDKICLAVQFFHKYLRNFEFLNLKFYTSLLIRLIYIYTFKHLV